MDTIIIQRGWQGIKRKKNASTFVDAFGGDNKNSKGTEVVLGNFLPSSSMLAEIVATKGISRLYRVQKHQFLATTHISDFQSFVRHLLDTG